MAVPGVAQPREVVLRRDPGIQDPPCTGGRPESGKQGLQRGSLGDVAFEDAGFPYEAAAVQNPAERPQPAIGAAFLGATEAGLGLPRRPAFVERVRAIVQRDRRLDSEPIRDSVEPVVLDRVTMMQERIRSPVPTLGARSLEVDLQQLAERTAPAPPRPGGALGTGARHASENRTQCGPPQRAGHLQMLQAGGLGRPSGRPITPRARHRRNAAAPSQGG